MNNDAMVALANWEDNQPVLYFFKDGLDEEKVVCILVNYCLKMYRIRLFIHFPFE